MPTMEALTRFFVICAATTIVICAAIAQPDTLWFGGLDPVTGLAVEGGIWDFEDCTPQGWTSVDRTADPIFFTHVTADSHVAHGDPVNCVITPGGSTGSMWLGAHQDYAEALCWPGGQGYSNDWDQTLARSFVYGGSGDVTLEFDYFVDSETEFDFTYVYVVGDLGVRSDPLNESMHSNDQGWGYSGSVQEGTAIGSPNSPAHDRIVVGPLWLPDSIGASFAVEFNFDSDPLYSDGVDSYGGFLNSAYGPFGVDNVSVVGVGLDDLSDFEPTGTPGEEYDGWVPSVVPGIGSLMGVFPLDVLDPPADPDCPLEGCVMIAADTDPNAITPHPFWQNEYLISNPIAVDTLDSLSIQLIQFQIWKDLPRDECVGYRVAMHYYPWTCPNGDHTGWTQIPAGNGGFYYNPLGGPGCYTYTIDNSDYLPTGDDAPDSLKLVFELLRDRGQFCESSLSNMSPYWDHIRVGFTTRVVDVDEHESDTPPTVASTLLRSVPNPFTPTTAVRFTLTEKTRTTIEIFDVQGARVRTLVDGMMDAGHHEAVWDGRDEAGRLTGPGIYWIRLSTAAGYRETVKVVTLN